MKNEKWYNSDEIFIIEIIDKYLYRGNYYKYVKPHKFLFFNIKEGVIIYDTKITIDEFLKNYNNFCIIDSKIYNKQCLVIQFKNELTLRYYFDDEFEEKYFKIKKQLVNPIEKYFNIIENTIIYTNWYEKRIIIETSKCCKS